MMVTDTVSAAGQRFSAGVRSSIKLRALAGILHLLVWFGFVRLLFHAVQPCLHIIRHSLSTVRIYLRFRIRAHNPTMPR